MRFVYGTFRETYMYGSNMNGKLVSKYSSGVVLCFEASFKILISSIIVKFIWYIHSVFALKRLYLWIEWWRYSDVIGCDYCLNNRKK